MILFPFRYVSTYTCTNTDYRPYFIRDASKSFPSGHSSVSVYGSIFMIWYLQKRCPKIGSIIALPLCQVVVATWGIFCSLSRIIDNRHHWWDVLAGAFIGVVAAYLTVSCRWTAVELNYEANLDQSVPSFISVISVVTTSTDPGWERKSRFTKTTTSISFRTVCLICRHLME